MKFFESEQTFIGHVDATIVLGVVGNTSSGLRASLHKIGDKFNTAYIVQGETEEELKKEIEGHYADFVAIFADDIVGISWDGFFSSFFFHGWDVMKGQQKKISQDGVDSEKLIIYSWESYTQPGLYSSFINPTLTVVY